MIGKKKLVARVSGYSLIGTSDEETGRRKVALLGVLHARGIIGWIRNKKIAEKSGAARGPMQENWNMQH
jgi:hypothetical protein